jgi:hypothetical protein
MSEIYLIQGNLIFFSKIIILEKVYLFNVKVTDIFYEIKLLKKVAAKIRISHERRIDFPK